jgi:hypothetical protein
MVLTLVSISRRPSGEPIEEEAETDPAESNYDREDRSKAWAYDGLEQDNVWDK